MIERLQVGADRNVRRFDLLAEGAEAEPPGSATDVAEAPGPPVEPSAPDGVARVLRETHGSPR